MPHNIYRASLLVRHSKDNKLPLHPEMLAAAVEHLFVFAWLGCFGATLSLIQVSDYLPNFKNKTFFVLFSPGIRKLHMVLALLKTHC